MYRHALILTLLLSSGLAAAAPGRDPVDVDNGRVRAVFTPGPSGVIQQYFARKGETWILIAESFRPDYAGSPEEPPPVRLYDTRVTPHRYLLSESLWDVEVVEAAGGTSRVRLTGQRAGTSLEQVVSLARGADHVHIEVTATFPELPAKLDYLLSTFVFDLDRPPEFIHTPSLKFDDARAGAGRDQIIGDRSFHAPAIILQEREQFCALVPDLNAINEHRIVSPDARRQTRIPRNKFSVLFEDDKYTMPTGLDLNVQTGLTPKPVLSYGLIDAVIGHHIRYVRTDDESMVRTLPQRTARYAFDLFVAADQVRSTGFQRVTRHQWEAFGRPVFRERPHLAMPFGEYVELIDRTTFRPHSHPGIDEPIPGYRDTGSWLEWEHEGVPVGGYRSAIPWWNDAVHNSPFWNNAREAPGFFFWGKQRGEPAMLERARRIVNLCLAAPRNDKGLFATLFNAKTKKWGIGFTDPPHGNTRLFLRDSRSYDVVTMSKTGAHLLDYYRLCEPDQRIVEYLSSYADWLVGTIDERGTVPAFVTVEMKSSPILRDSAHSAASLWFLAEMFGATKRPAYLDGARRIAAFLERDILPNARWIDFEQYFSCGRKPYTFVRDEWQHQYVRGNLCVVWAAEGFAALYRATGSQRHLTAGEQCIDYLTFTQCCWEPHYIYTAFPFGGFSVDNADTATMLDARQAETVKPFIWYGKELGRQDLLERAVAAARSSVVLIRHPRHEKNNIYRHPNIYPLGLGPENIDHEAHPQSAMRTHPSWGEGSGVFTGLAEATRGLGGVYVNVAKKLALGVDGVRVRACDFTTNPVTVELESWLSPALLAEPWEKPFATTLRLEGAGGDERKLRVNGTELEAAAAAEYRLEVRPDGTVRVVGEWRTN